MFFLHRFIYVTSRVCCHFIKDRVNTKIIYKNNNKNNVSNKVCAKVRLVPKTRITESKRRLCCNIFFRSVRENTLLALYPECTLLVHEACL